MTATNYTAAFAVDSTEITGTGVPNIQLRFYAPQIGTGDDAAAIQRSIDKAFADGGGTVDLSNLTWDVRSTITLDPTKVSLRGNGATLDAHLGTQTVILAVTTGTSGLQYGHATQFIEGIRFRGTGSGGTQTAVQFYTPTNTSDHSSRVHVRNLDIANVQYGLQFKQNAFCVKVYSVDIYNASVCIRVENETNRGEALAFFGCTLFNSDRCIQSYGSNQDLYFFACSFDYCNWFAYSDAPTMEFHGCHFERQPPTSTNRCFEVDNGARMKFFGGDVGFAAGTGTGTIFQIWGNGGSYWLDNVTGSIPSGCTLTSDATKFHSNAPSGSFV